MSFFNLSDFITVGVLQSGPNPVLKVRKITTNAEFALKKLKTHDYQQHLINVQNSLHLAACSHPNILELLGFSVLQTKNEQLYVPEYTLCLLNELHERTLEQEILKRNEKRNNFSLQEMLDLTAQIGKALIYLQKDARICHRDIKPSNILINSQGKFILSDFTESFQENELNKNIKNIVGFN